MTREEVYYEYFTKENKFWIEDAYIEGDYNYPVGKRRLDLLKRLLRGKELAGKKALDIGCGGGDISLYLASLGMQITAIDMSDTMLKTASTRAQEQSLSDKIQFYKENLMELSNNVNSSKYDLIVAYGLIGYLPSDDVFFNIVNPLLNHGGTVIVSVRNRLFNMTSISSNTQKEIEKNAAVDLIKELDEYYIDKISLEQTRMFLTMLRNACDILLKKSDDFFKKEQENDKRMAIDIGNGDGTGEMQPRQSTPLELKNTALKYGLNAVSFHGVHPHIMIPRMNRYFPKQVFNILSDALLPLDNTSYSLVWSSVVVGEFEKNEL